MGHTVTTVSGEIVCRRGLFRQSDDSRNSPFWEKATFRSDYTVESDLQNAISELSR